MRSAIVHEGVKHLEYEIRQIVDFGSELQRLGVPMTWENIGDPIAMGEQVAPWIREILEELVRDNDSWAYCPSRGVLAAREALAREINRRGGVQATPDDILFFNGVADAVDKIYDLIRKDARVLMQSPSYPTHTSNEAKRGDYERLQFHLDPRNDWQPDLDEIRHYLKYNPQIVAIALVNPDNPTGMVYPRDTLREIVEIARRNRVFLICDEIYVHIAYNGAERCHISEVAEDVPALALRGISKEYPWPGSRCGWVEMLNAGRDPDFRAYCDALVKAKMMEVCSTTLPQLSIAKIYSDPRYQPHLAMREKMFETRANETYETFRAVKHLKVSRPRGAFYFSALFEPGILNDRQTLPIENAKARAKVEEKVRGVPFDKRFVYYLMASEGICVTPLSSGFHCDLPGFRLTTLRMDDGKRRETQGRIARAVEAYIASA